MKRYWINALPHKTKPLRLGAMIASVGLICPEYLLMKYKADFSEWLLCDGRFLYSHEYPELFEAVGFIFGTEDMVQFRLPFLNLPFSREDEL